MATSDRRAVSFAELGRAALIQEARLTLPPDAKVSGGHWNGPEAERQADGLLRQWAAQGAPGRWTWNVRIQLRLEDDSLVLAWYGLQQGSGAPPIRKTAADYLVARFQDSTSLPAQRNEDRRLAELLAGHAIADPPAYPWHRVA